MLRIGAPAPDLADAFPDARRFGLLSAAKPGWAQAGGHAPAADGDRALQRTLDVQLLHRAAFDHRHPGFLGRPVDENILLHFV